MKSRSAVLIAWVLACAVLGEAASPEKALEYFDQASELRRKLEATAGASRTREAYQQVVIAFRRVYRITPRSSRADDSLLAEAELYEEMSGRFDPAYHQRAIETYRFLIQEYPHSPLVPDARRRLEDLERAPAPAPAPPPGVAKEAPAAAPTAALPLVTEIRHWTLADLTRVIVTLETDVHVKPERLTNPDRVFFDIPKTRLHPSLRHGTVPVGDERVKQIRVAQTQIGVTRVVVDLAADAAYSLSTLTNPPRLVMELKPKTVARPPAPKPPAPKTELAKAEPPKPLDTPKPPAVKPELPKTVDSAALLSPRPEVPKPPPPKAVETAKLPPPKPAHLPSREQNLMRALGLKIGRVVIDPGHGGHDTGTIGPTGLMEKELALDVARRLAELIENRTDLEVILTRTTDEFVALEDRTALANEKEADLFISIHANSSRAVSARGIETYYLSLRGDPAALEVAARENAASAKSIHDLQDLVTKIALTEKIAESREFAARVQRSLYGSIAKDGGGVRNRGVRKAPFVVLIGARMPSILAEISFLSNPRDEKLLKTAGWRQKIAEALYSGVASYAGTLSRVEVASRD
jgi:N-acetylmuramoyl-L-alanine amidase